MFSNDDQIFYDMRTRIQMFGGGSYSFFSARTILFDIDIVQGDHIISAAFSC